MIWPFSKAPSSPPDAFPQPDGPIWAIGDIHGCDDQFDGLLRAIEQAGGGSEPLVLLGDYADRGPSSAAVFTRIRALSESTVRPVTCLMGNHDRMLLDFLEEPVGAGPRFLAHGGQETLLSFGVLPASDGTAEERLNRQAEAFAARIGDLADWLRARPLWHRSGDCLFVHAQTDLSLPIEAQPESTLIWARPPKRIRPRPDGNWVIHGHTVTRTPRIEGRHIAIDTGAYRGGPLTAVRLIADQAPHFVQC
ncbi:MAG: metallophosphoesterase [Oceanicola sp.]|nr:metallophosphoesterase [Oceanicola sp.]